MHTKPIKKLTLYWGSPPKGKYIELVVILQANVFFSFLPTFFFLVKKKVRWTLTDRITPLILQSLT